MEISKLPTIDTPKQIAKPFISLLLIILICRVNFKDKNKEQQGTRLHVYK